MSVPFGLKRKNCRIRGKHQKGKTVGNMHFHFRWKYQPKLKKTAV